MSEGNARVEVIRKDNKMKELRELEALLKIELANQRGVSADEIHGVDASLVGMTIGTLYAIILGHKSALAEMNKIIERKKEALAK
jgi:hypothetical protein